MLLRKRSKRRDQTIKVISIFQDNQEEEEKEFIDKTEMKTEDPLPADCTRRRIALLIRLDLYPYSLVISGPGDKHSRMHRTARGGTGHPRRHRSPAWAHARSESRPEVNALLSGTQARREGIVVHQRAPRMCRQTSQKN